MPSSRFVRSCRASRFLAAIFSGCGVRVFNHEPSEAAAPAETFARTAFVNKDLAAAHALMDPESRRTTTQAAFDEGIAKMHPGGYPAEVHDVAFEPILGTPSMSIFLDGRREDEEFHYRLVMAGGKGTGYRVSFFARGSGPYPPSSARHPL